MNLFENLQLMKENSDIAKLGKKIKQYKGWKIYKGISDYGEEIFRLFTPDEDRPEIGYEDWETDTLEQAISWVDNYNLNESYDYIDSDENDNYYNSLYINGTEDLINKYTDIYNSEKRDLEEETTYDTYSFTGPVYRFGRIIDQIKEPIYTSAPSIQKAYSNFCYKLKKANDLEPYAKLEIDKNDIKLVEPEYNEDDFEEIKQDSGSVINDPKYNVEDERDDKYVVESIESFNTWYDKNIFDLLDVYRQENNLDEDDLIDTQSFSEYADNEYSKYVKEETK